MAVRADASGDYLSRTTNLPTMAGHTVSLWFKQATDLGAVNQSLIALDNVGYTTYLGFQLHANNELALNHNALDSVILGSTTVGSWYWCAYTHASAGSVAAYASLGLDPITTISGTSYSDAPDLLRLFDNRYSEPFDGAIAAVKIWDRVLSQNELDAERRCYLPVFPSNLNSYYPLWTSSDGPTDYSGNGRTWTSSGSLSSEDGPPIAWAPLGSDLDDEPYVVAAAGGGFKSSWARNSNVLVGVGGP